MDQQVTVADINADQVDYWSGETGEKWAAGQDELDTMLAPFGKAAIEAVALQPGDHVVDVGCGCGDTSFELASRVGPMGSVLAIDVSAPMLQRAGERLGDAALGNLRFAMADASAFGFEPEATDVVFSRFGVMFFRNPVDAFANLKAALRPGGRLGFVCWRSLDQNMWVSVPRDAALKHLPPPEPVSPDEPGPFAFADAEKVTDILRDAGFNGIVLERFDTKVRNIGSLDDVTEFVATMGPVSRLLDEVEGEVRERAIDEVRDALASHHDGQALHLSAATWIVTAKA
ncbi:MAG: class I SAM-dependent methyltransferase [Pseudomonadota bacterium]